MCVSTKKTHFFFSLRTALNNTPFPAWLPLKHRSIAVKFDTESKPIQYFAFWVVGHNVLVKLSVPKDRDVDLQNCGMFSGNFDK